MYLVLEKRDRVVLLIEYRIVVHRSVEDDVIGMFGRTHAMPAVLDLFPS